MIILACAAAVWIVCGILEYGFTFAYFQKEYPTLAERDRADDRAFALLCAFFGPAALMPTVASRFTKHGLLYR